MDASPPSPGPKDEIRCPSCGALVTPDAEWCGQCFTPLKTADVPSEERAAKIGLKVTHEPAVAESGAPAERADAPAAGDGKPRLTWPCPMCELDNEIETNHCVRCGTPFSALMKADERPVHIEPKDAVKASLIYPGLGHRKAGHGADGVARGTLFTLSLILLLVVVLSGVHSSGQDIMVFLYLSTTLLIYLGSAAEAHRIAAGGPPFVSARTLLWFTVGLLILSITLLAITATTWVRR
jgi:DNA-directed RNA polymerase subunit RPC12/RpoP